MQRPCLRSGDRTQKRLQDRPFHTIPAGTACLSCRFFYFTTVPFLLAGIHQLGFVEMFTLSVSLRSPAYGPGRNHRLLPALATNSPPDCLLHASRPQRGSQATLSGTAPCLSLWERWQPKELTERACLPRPPISCSIFTIRALRIHTRNFQCLLNFIQRNTPFLRPDMLPAPKLP